MSNNYFDPNWTAKVTVPVKRVGNGWEFFYGGDVPVQEGTLGALTINANQITDERFHQRVSQETVVKILDQGATLMVALSDRSKSMSRVGNPWPQILPANVPAGATRFEAVTIGPARKTQTMQKDLEGQELEGGLWLCLKGLERTELNCSTVNMPQGFPEATATSLNHAYTLLSKEHELHRISNTGNVYDRFFYQEGNGHWYPLADLRQGVQVRTERALISDVWEHVETALGWRPLVVDSRGKKRK